MKEQIGKLCRRTLSYLRRRDWENHRRVRPMEILWERSAAESADFILDNLQSAVLFDDNKDLWIHALKSMKTSGMLIECGVFQGISINFIAQWLIKNDDPRPVYGFDAFQGLEEDWAGENLSAGAFDRRGVAPAVRENVQLEIGWVQDTLVPFTKKNSPERIALLHIDTDTYSPAKFILSTLKPYLRDGSIVIFDELIGYPNWQAHEYRALVEELGTEGYDFIGFTNRQAVIRLR